MMSTQSNLNYRCDGVWLALLLALIITGSLRADEGRWLIVVENSAAMKSRLPSVDTVLKNLVMSDFGGNLRAGDSVGVWTFSDSLVTGKFPLTTWDPALAPGFMTNLLGYVDRLNYSGSPKFASLQPRLDQVIACYAIAGDADFMLQVVAADLDAYAQFSMEVLRALPHIKEMQTMFVLKEIKPYRGLPVASGV